MKRVIGMLLLFLSVHFSGAQPVKNKSTFQKSYVRVSKENPIYFELTSGETYIPVGANLCWAKDSENVA